MRKIGFVLLVFLLVWLSLATGLFIHNKSLAQQESLGSLVQNRQVEIPNAGWEPSFFKALDERAQKVKLPSLKTLVLSEQDLEVRFWYDGRPEVISGYVRRRSLGQGSAFFVRQTRDRLPSEVKLEAMPVPRSGWETTWEKLVSTGILTMPDASEVGCNSPSFDTVAYVIETNAHGVYRTYRYSNPEKANCAEANRIVMIEEIIGEEFRLHSKPKVRSSSRGTQHN